MDELAADVKEARAENERLGQQTAKLRVQLQVLMDPDMYRDPNMIEEGVPMAPDPIIHEEMLQLKRVLWDLQRENALIKEERARSAVAPVSRNSSPSSKGTVTMAEYRSLQNQVVDLRKAHEAAVAQTERLQARIASREGSPVHRHRVSNLLTSRRRSGSAEDTASTGVSVFGGWTRASHGSSNSDHARRPGSGSEESYFPISRMSSRDSYDNGTSRQHWGALNCQQKHAMSDCLMGNRKTTCCQRLGVDALSVTGGSTPRGIYSFGQSQSSTGAASGDIRQRLQVVQQENEQLRRKIRALAAQ